MANAEHRVGSTGGLGGRDAITDSGGGAGARPKAVRSALWLVVACFTAAMVALGGRHGVPLAGVPWLDPAGIEGTPFARLSLGPFGGLAEHAPGPVRLLVTLPLLVALALVAARALPRPIGRRTALYAGPVAVALVTLSQPVREAPWLGPAGVLPVLLVLLGCLVVPGGWAGGVLVGSAAALQPAVLPFAALMWLTGRRRAATATCGTFAAATALAWAVNPTGSSAYWLGHPAGSGTVAALADRSSYLASPWSGLSGPVEIGLFLAVGAGVLALGLRRAVRYAHDGQPLLAMAVTGCAAMVVSPVTWPHQSLWLLLAVVGRVGRRTSDRRVWPVAVVLVVTLPASMLLPNVAVLHPLRDNLVPLVALAAACLVPFLPRGSPYFASPIPTSRAAAGPSGPRGGPAPAFLRRVTTRPNLLLELLLIRVTYAAYSQVRLAVGGDAAEGRERAEAHGRQILDLERALGIDIEYAVNHAVVGVDPLRHFFDFYYTSFHFVVPLALLGVLYVRRPVDYRWARTTLGLTTLSALMGFWLYPLAPPRLMPTLGIVDTVHGVQDFSRPDYGGLTELTNQYAAMPSLHFGWSLWCGVVVAVVVRRRALALLGLAHPLFTLAAIVTTGNHWVLDAVGGAAVVGVGFLLTRLLQGPRTGPESADDGAGGTARVPAQGRAGPDTVDGARPAVPVGSAASTDSGPEPARGGPRG